MWPGLFVIFVSLSLCCCSEFFINSDDCILSSKNQSLIIDLTRTQVTVHQNSTYDIHFTLCPKKHKTCPINAFVCLDYKNKTYVDLGSEIVDIKYNSFYNVTIKSEYGIGSILIDCSNSESLPFMEYIKSSNYSRQHFQYEFKWLSTNSCPRRQYKTKNSCVLYTTEQSFDIRSLQHSPDLYYKKHEKTYYINLCTNVTEKQCPESSVCVVNNGKKGQAIASVGGSILQYIEGRGLTLSYRNILGGYTVIKLICSLESPYPVLKLENEEDQDLYFSLSQPLTCPSLKMDCMIHNKAESIYDLTVLNQLKDNWALDLKNKHKLIFNMCGPLNYIPHHFCSGRYFACLVDGFNKTLALGFKSQSQIIDNGQLLLRITGNTTSNSPFLLNITLECAQDTADPVLQNQIENKMIFEINWKTIAACPSQMSIGHNCRLNNVYHQTPIALSQLHKNEGDYSVLVGKESFRINPCGNLNYSCGKVRDASICYKNKDGNEIAIGQVGGSEPIFKDGQYIFHLDGAPCNHKVDRSKVKIILACEYSGNDLPMQLDPEFFQIANECEFYFYWRTNLVCTESSNMNCSIQVNKYSYDLSPLRNLKENYVVPYNESASFVLNVCRSVIPGYRIRCHFHSGACLVSENTQYISSQDYSMKPSYENLGMVSNADSLVFRDNKIFLNYTSGGLCDDGPETSKETVIIFECVEKGVDNPVLISSDNCKFVFKWATPYACPGYRPRPPTSPPDIYPKPTDKKDCVVIVKNKKYDLSELMNEDVNVENRHIVLGVCHPVEYQGCPENSGACIILNNQDVRNIGDYNTNLIFEENSVYLKYKASDSAVQTVIEFVCSKANLKPKFLKEKINNDGITTYYILWPTSLVCLNEVEDTCCHQIENLCDQYSGLYNVSIDNKNSVFLSLCKPVIPDEGLLCQHNTASCFASKINNSYIDEKSLGSVSHGPVFSKDKTILIEYLNGAVCEGGTRFSTFIKLFCTQNSTSVYPEFVKVHNKCRYEFNWGTSLLCNGNMACSWLPNIVDSDRIIDRGEKRRYALNLCRPSVLCGSYLCKSSFNNEWHSFVGPLYKTEPFKWGINYYFSPITNVTKLDNCGAQVEIRCDNNKIDFGSPELVKEEDCFVHIVLKGELGCDLALKDLTDETPGSSWYVIPIFLIISVLLIVPFLLKNQRRGIVTSLQRVLGYRRLNNTSSVFFQDSFDDESPVEFELAVKNQ